MAGVRKGKSQKTNKIAKFSTALVLVLVFSGISYWAYLSPIHTNSAGKNSATSPAPQEIDIEGISRALAPANPLASVSGHPIFPYSVVGGGVHSSEEAQQAVHGDAVVRRHYSGFNGRSAHLIHLTKDRAAYVSYRMGDRIFWTRHKVPLRAGEVFLSDGRSLIRARCGNRVSDTPQAPVSPHEPPDRVMSKPEFFPAPVPIGSPTWEDPEGFALYAPPGPTLPPGYFVPPIYLPNPPPVSVGPGSPGLPPVPPPPVGPGTGPVAAPEPSSWALLVLGLVCIFGLGNRRFSLFRR
jgi:hypothetical protein